MQSATILSAAVLLCVCGPLSATETRQMEAHEHGAGTLNIAFENNLIAMELEVPASDVVGFEYAPTTDADKAVLDAALGQLARPLDLFAFGASTGCAVIEANVARVAEGHDDDQGHDDDDDHDHGDEHGHDDEHAHGDEHDHGHDEDKGASAVHSEIHATFALSCDDLAAITEIGFPYFDIFPNAKTLDVQLVTDRGATGGEVTRAAPVLAISGAM
jgi:hypothetical protein